MNKMREMEDQHPVHRCTCTHRLGTHTGIHTGAHEHTDWAHNKLKACSLASLQYQQVSAGLVGTWTTEVGDRVTKQRKKGEGLSELGKAKHSYLLKTHSGHCKYRDHPRSNDSDRIPGFWNMPRLGAGVGCCWDELTSAPQGRREGRQHTHALR